MADEKLMLAFGRGNHEAFTVLLTRHQHAIYRFILRQVHHPTLAEDMAQDVFLRVCKNAATYTEQAKFTTWLYTIARNLCIDHIRRSAGRFEQSLDHNPHDEDDERSPLDSLRDQHTLSAAGELVRGEFRNKLDHALGLIPTEQREVFLMREIAGLKFREIGDIMGVSENTIKSRMRYALEALRGHLAEYSDFSFDADEAETSKHS